MMIPCAISPLHDRDVYDASDPEVLKGNKCEGEIKKPHWHVNLYFDSLKSFQQVIELLEPLGVKMIRNIDNRRSADRYLCHLNHVGKKFIYDTSEIVELNGGHADIIMPPTAEELRAIRDEVLDYIEREDICEYAQLVMRVKNEHYDWLDYVETHTIFLNSICRSRRMGGSYA